MKAKILFFCLIFFGLSGCAAISGCTVEGSGEQNVPRDSFVQISNSTYMKICDAENPDVCFEDRSRSVGSGAVFRHSGDHTFVLTAAHVCESQRRAKLIEEGKKDPTVIFTAEKRLQTIALNGAEYDAEILSLDHEIDTCVLITERVGIPVAQISKSPVQEGEKVWNVAAPLGLFDTNTVSILEGYYSGAMPNIERDAVLYSIPVAPGSSGSPIFNNRGEIVGMVHSVYTRFHHQSLSPSWYDLRNFLQDAVYDYNRKYK